MTKRNFYIYTFFLLIFLYSSCSNDSAISKLEFIKDAGNNDPTAALTILDSLEDQMVGLSKYEKCKFDLLRIRLNDKANIVSTSDASIKKLVEYFNDNGTTADKQEVNYYAGSVYRDLKDIPRALGYFLKSLEFAKNDECDSIMLRNTYSNLSYLYYRVQSYKDALDNAQKELEICQLTNSDPILPYMHLGTSYLAVDSNKQASNTFDIVYKLIIDSNRVAQQQGTLIFLLNHYSQLYNKEKAIVCFNAISKKSPEAMSTYEKLAFAQYYGLLNQPDSSVAYCTKIIKDNSNLFDMHDAAKLLYRIYSQSSDLRRAYQYAEKYIILNDSLDLGKRQELAATVNNEYKYHQDQKKEQELHEQNSKYRKGIISAFIITAFIMCIGFIIYYRKRNIHLQEILKLSNELERLSYDEKHLREEIERKETLLKQKIEQNKEFIKLLHQSELEEKAESVIDTIRQSAIGKTSMNSADWRKLYQAVDELDPTFNDRILKELGSFTEQQMQVCYLMRIGMSKPQIQNITNLSRVTVWRWVKKYDWVLATDENT